MTGMIERYVKKIKKAAFAACYLLSAAAGIILPVLSSGVYADEVGSEEIRIMFLVFNDMADMYITFAYGAMVLIFAVGIVKSGLTAQAAKQFGMAGKMSGEMFNILTGIVIFVLGILSFPIAKEVIKSVTGSAGMNQAPTTGNLQLPGIN
ncbi:MAG: hypothetical protein IJI14_02635 [Anaerolineaceae bacterium]|nr:hypothetical protein [Anaerolineaceae bacterium]